jgi:hypothetical protein
MRLAFDAVEGGDTVRITACCGHQSDVELFWRIAVGVEGDPFTVE